MEKERHRNNKFLQKPRKGLLFLEIGKGWYVFNKNY